MAIVQVSRITNRKGLEQDLPQPLAGAELGWAIDQRRLFIGNGDLVDGAPVVGNTEILTEFSDILNFATQYTYKGQAAGYVVQTGPTSGTPVSQSIQSRLDSYAVVTDFGAMGDGVTDDTAAINRALYQMFCVDTNPAIRRSLFFPAGRYIITDTLLIPPHALLYGEGVDSSIIDFNVQEWNVNSSYAAGTLVVITTGVGPYTYTYYRSNFDVPADTNIGDLTPGGDPYWDTEILPAYIARTTDSLQQTGGQIETNGATRPGWVGIDNMAFYTNQLMDGFLIEQATQCSFGSVAVVGPLQTADIVSYLATEDIAAVRFASTGTNICSEITWNSGAFSNFTYGISTDQNTRGITFSNNNFNTLYKGIVLDTAPTGFRILHNTFDAIYLQGISFLGTSLNATGYNVFYDVGNNFNGNTLAASSVILIDADNNISVGDMFQRTAAQSTTYARIELYDILTATIPGSIAFEGGEKIEVGTYVRETGQTINLTAGQTNTTLFTVTVGDYPTGTRAFKMDYTITRGTAVRTGTMTVVSIPDDSSAEFSYTDDYSENASTGITLTPSDTASTVGGTITMAYTSTSVSPSGTGKFYYSLTHLG